MQDFDGLMAAAFGLLLLIGGLNSADDADDPTLFASRIDGLLDPFWRQS